MYISPAQARGIKALWMVSVTERFTPDSSVLTVVLSQGLLRTGASEDMTLPMFGEGPGDKNDISILRSNLGSQW